MEDNGNISLLIMKELEEVVEEDGILPKTLNENEVGLEEWKEVNLDKVSQEAKVDDMESETDVVTEIDRFLQQSIIDEMESPVKDKTDEFDKALEARAKKLKIEIDSKKSEKLEIKHDEMVGHDLEQSNPHKNNIYGIAHKDNARVQSKDLDKILIYQDPGEALFSSVQLKKMQENTVSIWQQLTKWVSGMALCKTCEKAFPAGQTKILLKHMESKHKEELSFFETGKV